MEIMHCAMPFRAFIARERSARRTERRVKNLDFFVKRLLKAWLFSGEKKNERVVIKE